MKVSFFVNVISYNMCENCDCLSSVPSEMIFYEDKKPSPMCVICMDFMGEDNKSILPCGHEFHSTCFAENVLNANNTCPLCRTEVCKKAELLPKLTKTMTASFMESILNTPGGKKIMKNYIFHMCNTLGGWNTLDSKKQFELCRETIRLLMSFGFNLGGSIRSWIEEGNGRYQETSDDLTVQINIEEMVHLVDELIEEENNIEEENCSLVPLFDEDIDYEMEEGEIAEDSPSHPSVDEITSTIDFLYHYNLEHYLPRIIRNEQLRNLTNLLNMDIDNIMWPIGGPGSHPLFSRQEAEEIFGGILAYFAH